MSKLIRLPAPLGCLLAAIALVAGCGGSDSSGPEGPSANADSDPQTVLDTALGSQGDSIQSGVLDLSFALQGGQSASAKATVSGPFSSNGDGELPSVDFDVSANAETGGPPFSFQGGLTLTPDGLFIGYGGDEYQLDQSSFDLLKQSYVQSAQAQQDQGSDGGSLSQFGIDPATWLSNVTNEGEEDVDGTSVVHISGDADVGKIVQDLATVAQGTGQSIDSSGLQQLQSAVKSASIDVYADASNSALRKLDVKLDVADPQGGETDSVTFSIGIADPNSDQSIDAPEGAKPLTDLVGQVPGLAQSLGGATGATGSSAAPSAAPSTAPAPSSGATEKYYRCVAQAKTPTDVTDCQKLLG